MLASAHVLSVPTVYREPKGLFALEAMANGTPVVVPAHGGFPEMIEQTGGGVLVAPNSPQAVADGIRGLMDDPTLRDSLGRAGQEAVRSDRNDELMADRTLAVYEQYLGPNG